jgi:hypothetical protein
MSDVAHSMNIKLLFTPSRLGFSRICGIFSRLRTGLFLLPYFSCIVSAQTSTTVNLSTQSKNPDFSAMPVTRPVTVGTSLPSTCTIGQLFFNSAASAGGNLYSCTSANTWTVIGSSSSGGGSGNATAIQGATVSTTAPANNQALIFYGSSSSYIPTSIYTLQNGLGTSATGATNLQVNVSMGIRAVNGTTDTIVSTDCGGLITYNSSSAVAVALPQAGLGGNFLAGCPVTVHNYGSGTVTLTPGSGTIGGAASQAVNQNKGCLVVSDGSNWQLGNCN